MGSQESIGARLKREREKKNLSVEDVHLRLRIHPGVIQKLEADDLGDWPGGKIYARGFLRQYADFLGMNTPEVLSEFDSLGIAERPVELFVGLEKRSESDAVEAPRPRKPRTERKREAVPAAPAPPQPDLVRNLPPMPAAAPFPVLKWAVAIAAVVVIGLAIFQISRGIKGWLEQRPAIKVAAMAPAEKRGAAPAALPAGTTRLAARTAANKPGAAAATPAPAASRYLNSPSQGTYPKIRPQDRMMLEVHAITDVWMRIQADGNVVFESILHRGETERWLADKGFDAKLGRPEGVRVAMNGYPVGQPGGGKIKNLRFTREGIEEIRG